MTQQDIDYLKAAIRHLYAEIEYRNEAQMSKASEYATSSIELLKSLQPSDSTECVKSSVVGQSEQLLAFAKWMEEQLILPDRAEQVVYQYLESE